MPYGPTQFQLTVVKPYYKDNSFKPIQDALKNTLENALKDALKNALKDALEDTVTRRGIQYLSIPYKQAGI